MNVTRSYSIQTEAVEALIQELPKFRLKAVPDDCGECLICLEEFHIGHEVLNISFPNICEGINQLLMHKFCYDTVFACFYSLDEWKLSEFYRLEVYLAPIISMWSA